MSREGEIEANEALWWSHWATLESMAEGYLLHSNEFLEPLFNHAGLYGPPQDPEGFVGEAERRYSNLNIPPSFIVPNQYFALQQHLRSRGYRVVDLMHVMLLEGPLARRGGNVSVVVARGALLETWSRIYVESFGEDPQLIGAVKRAASLAAEDPAARLIVGFEEGTPSGVAALYTSSAVTGVYCVGTLKQKRRRGVATALLGYAADHAQTTGTLLALQTFESDGVEAFYLGLGFKRAYTKAVWVKQE